MSGYREANVEADNALFPYLALGFTPQFTPTKGEARLCGCFALAMSLWAVQDLNANGAPVDPSVRRTAMDIVELFKSDKYRTKVDQVMKQRRDDWDELFFDKPDVVFKKMGYKPQPESTQPYWRDQLLDEANFGREQLSFVLQVLNEDLGTHYELGIITQGINNQETSASVLSSGIRGPVVWIYNDNGAIAAEREGLGEIIGGHWDALTPESLSLNDPRRGIVNGWGLKSRVSADEKRGVWMVTEDSIAEEPWQLEVRRGHFVREPPGKRRRAHSGHLFVQLCSGKPEDCGEIQVGKLKRVHEKDNNVSEVSMLLSRVPSPHIRQIGPARDGFGLNHALQLYKLGKAYEDIAAPQPPSTSSKSGSSQSDLNLLAGVIARAIPDPSRPPLPKSLRFDLPASAPGLLSNAKVEVRLEPSPFGPKTPSETPGTVLNAPPPSEDDYYAQPITSFFLLRRTTFTREQQDNALAQGQGMLFSAFVLALKKPPQGQGQKWQVTNFIGDRSRIPVEKVKDHPGDVSDNKFFELVDQPWGLSTLPVVGHINRLDDHELRTRFGWFYPDEDINSYTQDKIREQLKEIDDGVPKMGLPVALCNRPNNLAVPKEPVFVLREFEDSGVEKCRVRFPDGIEDIVSEDDLEYVSKGRAFDLALADVEFSAMQDEIKKLYDDADARWKTKSPKRKRSSNDNDGPEAKK